MVTLHQIESGELGDPEIIKEVVCKLKSGCGLLHVEELYSKHERECYVGIFAFMCIGPMGLADIVTPWWRDKPVGASPVVGHRID